MLGAPPAFASSQRRFIVSVRPFFLGGISDQMRMSACRRRAEARMCQVSHLQGIDSGAHPASSKPWDRAGWMGAVRTRATIQFWLQKSASVPSGRAAQGSAVRVAARFGANRYSRPAAEVEEQHGQRVRGAPGLL